YSRDRDVDPVGACVGMKGTRVQAIIRELRGEKIDIVEWSDDTILFVTNALSPAKVQRVSIVDDKERVMEVVVEDKQLSLAIGKKGQNVRLAAKLTGWRIDIKSEEEKRREVEAQFEGLELGSAEPAAEASETSEDALPPEAAASDVPALYTLAGIGVKSASSTIEEVVARQFVDRLARQRNIALPSGDIFAETPVAKGKKPAAAKKPAEPVKPAAPALPPPRLVKTAKPAAPPPIAE